MKEKTTLFNIFKSRLARRVFFTFVACALIPVIVLAAVALYQVSHQLEAQAHQRLRQVAKSFGLSVYEHLLFCADELKLVDLLEIQDRSRQQRKFDAIGRRYPDGRYDAILGDPILPFILTEPERQHLDQGETVAVIAGKGDLHITLVRYSAVEDQDRGLLMGRIRSSYLWGIDDGNILPGLTECAVLSSAGLPLFQSGGWPKTFTVNKRQDVDGRHQVNLAGESWFVADWLLFLQPKFAVDSWSVVLLQPENHILAPIHRFKLVFILVVALSLMLVVGLSLFNLRRSLGPIQALKIGARQIARQEFNHRVEVKSKDEFLDLANSFNDMSRQLGRQFDFLATQAKIDKATLMASDFEHIAELSISRILRDFPFRMVAVGRVNADNPDDALSFVGHGKYPDTIHCQPFMMDGEDLARFRHDIPWSTITDRQLIGRYLPETVLRHLTWVTLFPVFVKGRLFALLGVAGHQELARIEEYLPLMRQIADHLAVAWSNVNLIRDLRRMSMGSMQALARAVDAKSSWTAGHSARVMRIALGVARHMKLDKDRIDRLQQAALLHDIGKIGIRTGILDKPGKLTDEEFATIRQHPAIGDKILSPIEAFRDIIPMVRQHHERWDGKGYPDGLAGEAILLEARILAVADVYDAMASDRPYRNGMPIHKVMSIIESEAGRQFDPGVVAVFLEIMQEKAELAA